MGRTRHASWQIGVSRTVDHPVEVVWELLTSSAGIRLWLGDDTHLDEEPGASYTTADGTSGEVHSHRPFDRMRLTWRPADWDHETTVQVVVAAAAHDRTRITIHQERLADAAERERQREHWRAVADRIVEELDHAFGA